MNFTNIAGVYIYLQDVLLGIAHFLLEMFGGKIHEFYIQCIKASIYHKSPSHSPKKGK